MANKLLVNKLITETAELIKGEFVTFSLWDLLEVKARLWWEEDRHPSIDQISWEVVVGRKVSPLEQQGINCPELIKEWVCVLAPNSTEYTKFNNKILDLCRRIDTLEQNNELDFDKDVLSPAQGLARQ